MKLKDVSKGDRVVLDNKISGDVDADIKNGIPGIDYTTDDKKPSFCYLEQITEHTKKPKVAKVKMIEQTINRPKFKDLEIGDKIIVAMAGGPNRVAIIDEIDSEIKNGMSGAGFVDEKEGGCWCYTSQIISVTKMVPEVKTGQTVKKNRI